MNTARLAPGLRASGAVLAAGALHGLSFSPLEAWWLQLLTLAVLANVCAQASAGQAAWLGGLFATGWLVAGFWWLYISMHQFGQLPPWLAGSAVLLLAMALSLYYALALALWARCRPSAAGPWGVLGQALSWAACWLLAELARATFLTGFPWIASGYAHTTGPFSVWAPWGGVYGLCALAALAAFALAAWMRAEVSRLCAAQLTALVLGLVALGWCLPHEFTRSTGTLSVSLLQPNVPQDLKFDPSRVEANLQGLTAQMHAAQGQLVITPESVVPLSYEDVDPAFWQALRRPFAATGRGALVGIFLGNDESGYVNSLVGLSEHSEQYQYGKRHLLPFGEVIPPGFAWLVQKMNIPLANQARGQSTAAFELAGQRIRPLICFEDLFGEDMASSMVGPDAATLLANASNLAWFGRLLVQDQHLQFSQMRALEFQRPVVRATNTGATAVVNHRGEVVARLPALRQSTLEAVVEGRIGDTPYARWLHAYGLWPLWGLAALVVLAVLALSRNDCVRSRS
jgi:apolipoprotein N-acyltransferase